MVLKGYYAMGKTPIKHTLAGYIIKKTDTEGYRSGKLTGEKHLNKITEMMEFVGGRRKLIDQARFIENNTQAGHDGRIRINWTQVNSDIKKIDCDVSSIPELCRLEGIEDSRAKQLRLIESVKQWKSEVGDCDWICRYYDDILGRLEAGKSVCTSNEALVAEHGPELLAMAKERNLNFMFEASVGGGIPIIRPLKQSMAGDPITAGM